MATAEPTARRRGGPGGRAGRHRGAAARGRVLRRPEHRADRHARRASRAPPSTSTSATSASCSCASPRTSPTSSSRRPTAGARASGDAGEELRGALASIAALYDEHGVLLRAIVEVSTYDEEVAALLAGADRPLRRGHAAPHRARAGGRARAPDYPRRRPRSRSCWMTERVVLPAASCRTSALRATSSSARSATSGSRAVYGAR